MLRFTRHVQATARQQLHQQQHHATHPSIPIAVTHTTVAPLTTATAAAAAAARRVASQSTNAHLTNTRTMHTIRAHLNDAEETDPVKLKERFRAQMAAKKAAEAARRAEELKNNPELAAAEAAKEKEAAEAAAAAKAGESNPAGDASTSSQTPPIPPTGTPITQNQVNQFWKWCKSEISYIKQHVDAKKVPTKKQKLRPTIQRTTISLREWSEDPAEKAAAKLKAEKAKEDKEGESEAEPAYTGTTALQAVSNETVWDKRLTGLKEALKRFGIAAPKKAVRGVVAKSETLSKLQEDLQDTVEEAREKWETSQDPRVWKMRDTVDKVFGESETGMALGEIMSADPNWNYLEFLKEMEEVMIPEVIKAFRLGDMKLLRTVVEGEAARAMLGSFRAREEQKVQWDDRILDVRGVDVVKASLHEDQPFIHLSFVCQHVAVEYDVKTGEPKDPSLQSVVQNTYYSWAIKRDFESPYYEWKIFEFQYQNIQALV